MAGVKKVANGRYEAWYRDDGGKEKTKRFQRKGEAQDWLDRITAALVRGDYVDANRSRMPVATLAEEYLAGVVHLKPKTVAGYESLLKTRILPTWGEVPLAGIRHSAVVAWVAAMRAEGLSASRTRQAYHLFKAMLDGAVRDRRLASNPASGIALPRLPRVEQRYLDHDELYRLAEGCGPHQLVVLVLGYCGIRWSELAALRTKHVNLLRRRIYVTDGMTEVNGRAVFGDPKSHQARWVPIPALLVDELAVHLAGRNPEAFVFPSPRGQVLRVNNFRRARFDRAAIDVGLEGFTPHELRHTAASLAIAEGANIKAVQRMLGHASATLTLDRYGHLFADDLDDVAERLDVAARAARARAHQEVRGNLAEFSRTSRPLATSSPGV